MDSKRTTHVLLTVIALGIFFMIFLYMKENYFNTPRTQPVVWEETVPAQPRTVPITTPTPNPVINPVTPTPVTQQNINLVVGQSYPREFTTDTSIPSAKYCGIKEYTPPYETPRNYMIFSSGNSCVPGEINTFGLSLTQFDVDLKSGISLEKVNELNQKYGAVFVYPSTPQAWPTILSVGTSNLNAYTLAKLYYDTGYFKWTSAGAGFSINSNDADY